MKTITPLLAVQGLRVSFAGKEVVHGIDFSIAPGEKLALVGDVLFQQSIGRTDFPKGNHQQLISSIREKLFPLGDDVRFIPGHGPMSTFGDERIDNPYVADGQR